mmetsp:Transcript_77087/g.170195  ORF Transcript_77087/g.170195 Transcript_77087/m.170195 type:complete len:478 (+) Transcript_77087:59-1492(+)
MVTLRGVRSVVCCLSLHALLPAVTAVRSTNQLAQDTRAAFVEDNAQRAEGMALVHPQNEGTAEEKLKTIWQKILDDKEEPGKMPSALAPLKLMSVFERDTFLGWLLSWFGILEDLRSTFGWHLDYPLPEYPPPKHEKLIHPVGSVAKVSLVWDEATIQKMGYTGVFAKKQENVLMRIGPAGAPKKEGQAPGVSIKVLRDHQESVNTVMLYSLRGQEGFSHFNHTLCNKLSDFRDKSMAEKLLLKSFKTASAYPFTTGLGQWAQNLGKFGRPEQGPENFPFVMCLKPMDDVRTDFARFHDVKFKHIQDQLGVLNPKKIIYEIYAAPEPRTPPTKIGYVQLLTKFHKTKFGDTELFFRHDWFENDLKKKPKWKPHVDDPDFWFEEGAAHFYKTIDPGATDVPRYSGNNAWIGGYDPKNQGEISANLKELVPDMNEAPKSPTGEAMLQTDGGFRVSRCETECSFAYLQQGESSIIHSLLR